MMNYLHKSKKFGKRGLVSFYQNLLKKGIIKKNGSAHNRLVELKMIYNKERLD